jgi:hypothetical protein
VGRPATRLAAAVAHDEGAVKEVARVRQLQHHHPARRQVPRGGRQRLAGGAVVQVVREGAQQADDEVVGGARRQPRARPHVAAHEAHAAGRRRRGGRGERLGVGQHPGVGVQRRDRDAAARKLDAVVPGPRAQVQRGGGPRAAAVKRVQLEQLRRLAGKVAVAEGRVVQLGAVVDGVACRRRRRLHGGGGGGAEAAAGELRRRDGGERRPPPEAQQPRLAGGRQQPVRQQPVHYRLRASVSGARALCSALVLSAREAPGRQPLLACLWGVDAQRRRTWADCAQSL